MKIKKYTLLTALLILISCQSASNAADVGGSNGLTVTLGTIPGEAYAGQTIGIPITLENAGLTDVENAMLSITGYNENFVHFSSKPKTEGINLFGRTTLITTGERTTKVFSITSITLPGLKERTESFDVNACFPYRTEATPIVCINPEQLGGVQAIKPICDFTQAKLNPTQGAPIAVTRVDSIYLGSGGGADVEFRIYVQNVGRGVITDKLDYGAKCLGTQPTQENGIGIEAYLGGQKIDCRAVSGNEKDKFTLVQNSPSVICRAAINNINQAYTTTLSIYLSYGYIVSKQFSINLKNPLYVQKS